MGLTSLRRNGRYGARTPLPNDGSTDLPQRLGRAGYSTCEDVVRAGRDLIASRGFDDTDLAALEQMLATRGLSFDTR